MSAPAIERPAEQVAPTKEFVRVRTPDAFWERPARGRTSRVRLRVRTTVYQVRQGWHGVRAVRLIWRAGTAPVDGASRLARKTWQWIRADDYAGTDDFKFREQVRTRRRRTTWWVGTGYLATAAASTTLYSGGPYLAAGALIGLCTAVEIRQRIMDRPVPLRFPGMGKGATPAENTVIRAAIDAKLGRAEGMKLAGPVLTEADGWSTVLQLPAGQRARKCLGLEADFASALGVGESQVFFAPILDHAGRLSVYVTKSDPFLKVHRSPLIGRREALDFWQGVPAGVDGRGQAHTLRLVDASLLVAGEPRAGKSAAVNQIIGAAALAVTPKIHLFDGKGAGDHRPWRRIAETSVKRNSAALLAHLRRQVEEMERVFDLLDENGGGSKLTPELCRTLGVDIELTVVDETRYYVTSPQGEEIVTPMIDIASRGPAAGKLLVIATQRMTTDALPGPLKGVCSLRWGMRCPDKIASNAVLGQGAAGAGYDCSEIPRSHRGVGILDADGADPAKIRSYFMDDEGTDLVDVAEAAYELRRAAGTLPIREAPPVDEDPVELILEAFDEADRLHTVDLVAALGDGWTASRIAAVLKPHGITPGDLKIAGVNRNGYRREEIEAIFAMA